MSLLTASFFYHYIHHQSLPIYLPLRSAEKNSPPEALGNDNATRLAPSKEDNEWRRRLTAQWVVVAKQFVLLAKTPPPKVYARRPGACSQLLPTYIVRR